MKDTNDPSLQHHPTIDLVHAARAGDEIAWAAIYDRYYALMRFMIHGRIPDHARARFDTEDVMQSGFMIAFEQIATFEDRGEAAFQAWLAELMRNRLRDKIRFNSRQRRDSHRDEAELESGDQRPFNPTPESPSVIAAAAERVARIVGALNKLEPRDQKLITLRTLERLSWAEIAEQLQVGETTARRRFYESFERLLDKVV